jgi:hypothetical protein
MNLEQPGPRGQRCATRQAKYADPVLVKDRDAHDSERMFRTSKRFRSRYAIWWRNTIVQQPLQENFCIPYPFAMDGSKAPLTHLATLTGGQAGMNGSWQRHAC